MREDRARRWGFWLLDHSLLLGGAALLAVNVGGPTWLLTPGLMALGLAALAWLAESNGYAIPRPGRVPILGLGFNDPPLAFGVSRGGRHFLFTRSGELVDGHWPDEHDWPDEYVVHEVAAIDHLQVANGFWHPPAGSFRYNAVVPSGALRFEHHERSYVDRASLRSALGRVVPGAG